MALESQEPNITYLFAILLTFTTFNSQKVLLILEIEPISKALNSDIELGWVFGHFLFAQANPCCIVGAKRMCEHLLICECLVTAPDRAILVLTEDQDIIHGSNTK